MSTATNTLRNGTLQTQVFLAVGTCVLFYALFVQDWSPLKAVRIQSPITFIQPSQPAIGLAAGLAVGAKTDTIRIATATQFDLSAIARAENIALTPEDNTLDRARQEYIRKYAAIAVAEMKRYGIPASVTLAQGLLETRAGQSGLAQKNNNHFGMKCFSRSCKRGHCTNFSDDTHKDFFLKFPSAWASYRAHSKLLTSGRYKSIRGDYHAWAYGLQSAGYATSRTYAEDLIRLIRLYGLDRLDKM